MAEFPKNKLTI